MSPLQDLSTMNIFDIRRQPQAICQFPLKLIFLSRRLGNQFDNVAPGHINDGPQCGASVGWARAGAEELVLSFSCTLICHTDDFIESKSYL